MAFQILLYKLSFSRATGKGKSWQNVPFPHIASSSLGLLLSVILLSLGSFDELCQRLEYTPSTFSEQSVPLAYNINSASCRDLRF